MQRQANTVFTLHTAICTPRTSHFTLALHIPHFIWALLTSSELFSSPFISSHMSAKFYLPIFISSEHSSTFLISPKLVSTHLVSSAHQKPWDTDAFTQKSLYKKLCSTKLAQSTSQYYFVLQSCTEHVPVRLCTTKLAQSTSLYHKVLQSLHKELSSMTLYYKACTEHVPVLLCTTKLAQSTSQYYFVLQSLNKVLPSTTLYYKARPL